MELPHSTSDLMLAPVVLAISSRIDALGRLSAHELAIEVALTSDTPDWSTEFRRRGLLRTIVAHLDCRGWRLTWADDGVRLSHGERSVVLAVPRSFTEYVDEPASHL